MNDIGKRVREMIKQANYPELPDDIGKMLDKMTPEERQIHRQMSELGTLPGSEGGGFDLLYGEGEKQ